MMDCRKELNKVECNCSKESCPRKGFCCECIANHRKKRQLPACFFPAEAEKTFDRSIEHFVRLVAEGKI